MKVKFDTRFALKYERPAIPAFVTGGGGPVLAPYEYQAESVAYFNAFGAQPAARRKYSLDRMRRRLKAKPTLYAKIKGAWLTIGNAKLIDVITPTRVATGGTGVTEVDNVGITGDNTITTGFIDTGFSPASAGLTTTNIHFGAYIAEPVSVASSGTIAGLLNAGGSGFQLITKDSGVSDAVTGRLLGTTKITLMTAVSSNGGRGLYLLNRNNGSNIEVYRNQRRVQSALASAVSTMPSGNLYINGLNNNGAPSTGSNAAIAFVTIGEALTQAEALDYYAIIRTLLDEMRSGEPTFVEPGYLSGFEGTFWDAVVCATTPTALGCAAELKRQGKNVLLVGQLFERHLGGMMSGGLGKTDLLVSTAVAGIWSAIKYRANQFAGGAVNDFAEPRFFEWAFRRLFDPSRGGFDVPVIWSNGFSSVVKNATRDWTITTRDGRQLRTKLYFDGTYEGDIVALVPGVTYTIGREAAGTGLEAANGVDLDQLVNGAGAPITVSPLVNPADNGSGFLAPIIDGTGLVVGTGDIATYRNGQVIASSGRSPRVQAFNKRITVTSNAYDQYDIAPSPVYAESNFELLFRTLAAAEASGSSLTFTNGLTTIVPVGSTSDLNNGGYVSTDYIGYSHNYLEADPETRAALSRAHDYYIRDLLYTMQNSSDPRVSAGNKAIANSYKLDGKHYLDPIEGGDLFWPYTLYVREGRHIVGPLKWDANDIGGTDGGVPRSTKTIAAASYEMDSHQIDRVARLVGGIWRTFAEGGLMISAGGADHISPLPMEIFMPVKSECEDMMVGFACSMTHLAFASARMEPTMIAIGQGCGMVMAEALDTGLAVQDVNYDNVRTRLLASASLPGETQPYLPQVH